MLSSRRLFLESISSSVHNVASKREETGTKMPQKLQEVTWLVLTNLSMKTVSPAVDIAGRG